MIRRITMLVTAALLAMMMTLGGAAAAFAAPRSCADNSNGCKTDTTSQHSGNSSADFNTTETQRGNTDAKGTETTSSTCTGPSGKALDPSHPQCS